MLKWFAGGQRRASGEGLDDARLDDLLARYEVLVGEERLRRMMAGVAARIDPPQPWWSVVLGPWSLPSRSLALGGVAVAVACGLWIGLSLTQPLDGLPSDTAWTRLALNLDSGPS